MKCVVREITFTLPLALPSLNVALRTHWSQRRNYQRMLANEVMAAVGGPRHYPRPPFARARVLVVRHSAGQLDADNLAASCKSLLDVLCVNSPTHPFGLGFIEDDSSARVDLVVTQQGARKAMTAVRLIEVAQVAGRAA